MFVLRHVRTRHVHKRRVRLDDTVVAKVLECHKVFSLTDAVKKSAAKRQRAEVSVVWVIGQCLDGIWVVFGYLGGRLADCCAYLSMTPRSCLARGRRSGTCPTS